MKLTKLAQDLRDCNVSTQDHEELGNEIGSDCFCYSLFTGGYIHPENWIEGEDLIKLQDAIRTVKEFKIIVEELSIEM